MKGNSKTKEPDSNIKQNPNVMDLKFQEPTITEYLESLTLKKKNLRKDIESFCGVVWNAYVSMSDEERIYLINGIIERSGQLEMMSTKMSKGTQYNYEILAKRQSLKKKEKQCNSYINSSTIIKEQTLNENLYSKLLNVRHDHQLLIQHLSIAGLESTKVFVQLMTKRCEKVESILKSYNIVCLANQDDLAYSTIMDRCINLLNAKNATIYNYDKIYDRLVVRASSWRRVGSTLECKHLIGSEDLLIKKNLVSLHTIKSMIIAFDDDIVNGYMECELDCLLSVPVLSIDNKIVGIIELVDKRSGSPLFDAEDEFIINNLAGMASIVMSHNEMREESRQSRNDIQAILKTASLLSTSLDISDLIRIIMLRAQEILSSERVTLFLVDKKRQQLWSTVAKGMSEIRIPINRGIAGYVATSGTTLNIPDAYSDPRFSKDIDIKTGFRTRNILCMPMQDANGEILGVTQIINKLPVTSTFNTSDEMLLQAFSSLAGATIEKSLLLEKFKTMADDNLQLKNDLDKTMESITDVVMVIGVDGFLIQINHPEEFGLSDMIYEMKSTSYTSWLKMNQRLVNDITKVLDTGETVQVYDYDIDLVKQMSVNYRIIQLKSKLQARANITSEKNDDQVYGALLVIELISTNKLTTLFEKLSASKTIENLNTFFSRVVDCVLEQNGIVDSYQGDSAVCVFGLPIPGGNDCVQAIDAALKVQSSLAAINSYNRRMAQPHISIGMGVSTSVCLSGSMGSTKKMEYTFIGPNVPLCRILKELTKVYGVFMLLEERTRERVVDSFNLREIDMIKVKTSKPIAIYEISERYSSGHMPDTFVEAWRLYSEGLKEYRKCSWEMAINYFAQSAQLISDPPSKRMIDRIRKILSGQIDFGNNWDGSWRV